MKPPIAWPQRRLPALLLLLCLGSLSGLLFVLSIPAADLYPLAWIFLLPALVALPCLPPSRHFALGLVAGLVAGAGRTYWITQTLELYGNLPLPPALLTNALLVLYLALYSALFLVLCGRLRLASPLFPWIAAAAWVLLEWVQNWMISGFPWELVGYSQYRFLPLLQVASITGVYGLSFLVVLANASLARALILRRDYLAGLGPPLLLLAALVLWGQQRLRALDQEESPPALRVGVVQGNISQDLKWKEDRVAATTSHYAELARRFADSEADLIVFPETALPFYFTDPYYARYREQIEDLARQVQTPVLVGSLEGRVWEEPRQIYNRAFLIDAGGQIQDYADKVHLVPFGEYLPFPWLFRYMEGLIAESGAFAHGRQHRALALPGADAPFGVFICYESIFPEITRALARDGATFLINTTNDAWFGRTAAPYQHFSMAVLRAVESGLPVLRAANTGISGLIAPGGQILHTTGLFTTETPLLEVRPRRNSTFYARHGDILLLLCALFLITLRVRHLYLRARRVSAEEEEARRDLERFARQPRPLPRPLVVLHGYDSSPASWEPFLAALRRCCPPDQAPPHIPDLNADLPLASLAERICRLLPDGPVDLVGHSLGGVLAMDLVGRCGVQSGRIAALAAPFGGTFLARLARLLRLPFPHLLADLVPGSPFLRAQRARAGTPGAALHTFRMDGDPVSSAASAQVPGAPHRAYAAHPLSAWPGRHRRLQADPRLIRDLIALLQERPHG